MALDPVSSSTTGIALAAGTVTLTGSIFGVEYEALLAGFFGGLCFITYTPATTKLKLAATLVASSLMAGFFAPIVSVGLLNYFPWLKEVSESALSIGVAAWIGLASQSAVPYLLAKLNKKIGE